MAAVAIKTGKELVPDVKRQREVLAPTGFGVLRLREEVALELCEGIIDLSAAFFNVSSKELRQSGRTPYPASRVRQVAMYVAHVGLRLSPTEIGRGFGRDRKTVLHACQVIEDMRDDPDFDNVVAQMERVATVALRHRIGR